jgi:VanZ family protein
MPLQLIGYRSAQVWLATSIASLYGISDEFHQSFVPGRTPDVVDWLADTSGALLAVLLIAHFSRSFNRSRRLG